MRPNLFTNTLDGVIINQQSLKRHLTNLMEEQPSLTDLKHQLTDQMFINLLEIVEKELLDIIQKIRYQRELVNLKMNALSQQHKNNLKKRVIGNQRIINKPMYSQITNSIEYQDLLQYHHRNHKDLSAERISLAQFRALLNQIDQPILNYLEQIINYLFNNTTDNLSLEQNQKINNQQLSKTLTKGINRVYFFLTQYIFKRLAEKFLSEQNFNIIVGKYLKQNKIRLWRNMNQVIKKVSQVLKKKYSNQRTSNIQYLPSQIQRFKSFQVDLLRRRRGQQNIIRISEMDFINRNNLNISSCQSYYTFCANIQENLNQIFQRIYERQNLVLTYRQNLQTIFSEIGIEHTLEHFQTGVKLKRDIQQRAQENEQWRRIYQRGNQTSLYFPIQNRFKLQQNYWRDPLTVNYLRNLNQNLQKAGIKVDQVISRRHKYSNVQQNGWLNGWLDGWKYGPTENIHQLGFHNQLPFHQRLTNSHIRILNKWVKEIQTKLQKTVEYLDAKKKLQQLDATEKQEYLQTARRLEQLIIVQKRKYLDTVKKREQQGDSAQKLEYLVAAIKFLQFPDYLLQLAQNIQPQPLQLNRNAQQQIRKSCLRTLDYLNFKNQQLKQELEYQVISFITPQMFAKLKSISKKRLIRFFNDVLWKAAQEKRHILNDVLITQNQNINYLPLRINDFVRGRLSCTKQQMFSVAQQLIKQRNMKPINLRSRLQIITKDISMTFDLQNILCQFQLKCYEPNTEKNYSIHHFFYELTRAEYNLALLELLIMS